MGANMRLHHKHGGCIILEENNTKAQRIDGFCDGLVFSSEPISTDVYYTIATTLNDTWCGALSIGLTNHDPISLPVVPKYISPYLISQPGFWAVFISENHITDHNRLTFHVNKEGQFRFVTKDEEDEDEIAITNLPILEPLWLMIDIFGSTTGIKVIQEDELPLEVYAKGPDAVFNFNLANNSGAVSIYRTRVMILGNHQSGKSYLKKILMSETPLNDDVKIQTRVIKGIQVSGCFVMDFKKYLQKAVSKSSEVGIGQSPSHLSCTEHIFYQNLTTNIARKELALKKKKAEFEDRGFDMRKPVSRGSWRVSAKGDRHVPRKTSQSFNSGARRRHRLQEFGTEYKTEIAYRYLNELPEDITLMIQQQLHEMEPKQFLDLKDNEKDMSSDKHLQKCIYRNITYSIWDIDTQTLHSDLLQFVFSPRALYILVVDLDDDFDFLSTNCKNTTKLDEIIYWINCIHAYATPSVVPVVGNATSLSPTVMIIGTYKKSISEHNVDVQEKMIEEIFLRIQDQILDKPFHGHVATPFFALEIPECPHLVDIENNEMITRLRTVIRDVVTRQPFYGEEFPVKWLRFEDAIGNLLDNNIYLVELSQIQEIARTEGIDREDSQRALLSFYHDIGLLMHFNGIIGAQNDALIDTVIIDPLWLIDSFNELLQLNRHIDENMDVDVAKSFDTLEAGGILEDSLVDLAWRNKLNHKAVLLELMTRLDLTCQINQMKSRDSLLPKYYLPCKVIREFNYEPNMEAASSTVIYLDFLGFLPDGIFYRLVLRTIQWIQSSNHRRSQRRRRRQMESNVTLYYQGAIFRFDDSTDFSLQIQPEDKSFIKLAVYHSSDAASCSQVDDVTNNASRQSLINPHISAKIRNFIESSLADLRELWMKRLAYKTCILCPCDRICTIHQKASCHEKDCRHYLLLDDCLTNSVVPCDYRHVKTQFIRKRFPKRLTPGHHTPILPEAMVMRTVDNETVIMDGIGMVLYQRPTIGDVGHLSYDPRMANCLRNVAKYLNIASEGRDWAVLAENLGYRQTKVVEFGDDLNPGLALITDWLFSSGNSSLSIDMLVSCLKRMGNHQAVDLLNDLQDEKEDMPVFISYQWDAQDEVVLIRNRLEQHGLRCWMDIGQMGGGDLLYNHIYRGISHAKVILTCITPKYVVSHNCTRETSLADLLGKPIIPVMVSPTPWPPPGPLAVLLSQMIYVDMCGIGGHGGTGFHADWEDRVQEIINQIYHYVAPIYRRINPPSPEVTSPTRDTLSRNDSLPTFLSMEAEDVHQGNELLNYNQQISTESPDDEGGSYEYNETPAAAATAAAASSASSPLSNNAEDGQSSNDNDSENNVDAASSSRSTNSSARRHSRVNNCTICTIL